MTAIVFALLGVMYVVGYWAWKYYPIAQQAVRALEAIAGSAPPRPLSPSPAAGTASPRS
jgi:hypothetical protein